MPRLERGHGRTPLSRSDSIDLFPEIGQQGRGVVVVVCTNRPMTMSVVVCSSCRPPGPPCVADRVRVVEAYKSFPIFIVQCRGLSAQLMRTLMLGSTCSDDTPDKMRLSGIDREVQPSSARRSLNRHRTSPFMQIVSDMMTKLNRHHGSVARWASRSAQMPYDFRTQRLFVDAPLHGRRRDRAGSRAGELSPQRAAHAGGRADPRSSTGATASGGRAIARGGAQGLPARRGGADARADAAPRPPLSLRAAEACAPRLHGAEGGRDGRRAAPARPDAAHAGRRA